jgi:hypothetical protein
MKIDGSGEVTKKTKKRNNDVENYIYKGIMDGNNT